MKIRSLGMLLALLVLGACDGDDPTDAGMGDGGTCAAASDCDDGIFCNGAESCEPGTAGADARGCVSEPACPGGAACDEDADDCGEACSAPDADGDGHDAVQCGGDDCDDTDANRYPGNPEVCDLDGHDEDCDASTFGDRDLDDDGHVDARCCNGDECGEDCDETRRGTNPNVPEVCDGRDNDCDGVVDEELLESRFTDADRDLHGDPEAPIDACPGRAGTSASMLDCDDDDPTTNGPQTELRDGEDNDCDGEIDEVPVESTFFPDVDGDGYGDPTGTTITSDEPVTGYALLPLDCDDDDASRSPVATEVCDAVDNDCDGEASFVIGVNDWEDDDGDGVADAACGGTDCDDTDPSTRPGEPEQCDQRDNDCDGTIDEDCGVDVPPPDGGTGGDCREGGESCGAGGGANCCTGICEADGTCAYPDIVPGDAGPMVNYCGAPAAVVASSGTGTSLYDGSPSPSVVETVATVTTDTTSGWITRVTVHLSGFTNICGRLRAGHRLEEGRGIIATLIRRSDTAPPGLPGPGTYPLLPSGEPLPLDTWVFQPLGYYYWYETCTGSPGGAIGPGPDQAGSLTLTTVSASAVEGSYTYNHGNPGEGDSTGTFAAPILDCARTDPEAPLCCEPNLGS